MAAAAGVTIKTWNKVERGETELTLSQFASVFLNLGEPALRCMLDIIYPETFAHICKKSGSDAIREAGKKWISEVCTDDQARMLDFVTFGRHGSNINAQLVEFTMIDQLPMHCRLIIAQNVLMMWRIAKVRGELICEDDIEVNIDAYIDALLKGRDAVLTGKNGYTTIAGDNYESARTEKITKRELLYSASSWRRRNSDHATDGAGVQAGRGADQG